MFYEQRTSVPDAPTQLIAEYEADLALILERTDLDAAAAETGLERDQLESLLENGSANVASELTLEEAAAIQALGEGEPNAETIELEACEHLLLGMSMAVLDVEAVESDLEIDLDAKEVQQKIERRAPMTLEEFGYIQYAIVDRSP